MLWCSHMFLINVHKVISNQMTLIGFLFRQRDLLRKLVHFEQNLQVRIIMRLSLVLAVVLVIALTQGWLTP